MDLYPKMRLARAAGTGPRQAARHFGMSHGGRLVVACPNTDRFDRVHSDLIGGLPGLADAPSGKASQTLPLGPGT